MVPCIKNRFSAYACLLYTSNRILGIPIFVAVMWLVYYVSVTTVGTFVTDWTNDVFVVAIQDFFTNILTSIGAGDLVMGLVVDGIIGGLGAVLGFVPQMAILFLFLSILEDCGYMVRIAFVDVYKRQPVHKALHNCHRNHQQYLQYIIWKLRKVWLFHPVHPIRYPVRSLRSSR